MSASIREIMSTDLVKVAPATSIAEAATVMSTKGVGSALVMEGDRLVGIFTERDTLRAVAADFDGEQHQVREFMTSDPTTIGADSPADEALESMFAFGFRHLPVMEAGVVVGIVSMRDVMRRV
ncbi:MAG: CBS domain-containing protein [Actinomycetota bacterium]